MECTLMHKNVEVAELVIDEAIVGITHVGSVSRPEHLPLGVMNVKGDVDRRELSDWLRGRSIPASRDGIKEALNDMGVSSPELLIEKCYGLSLSDQYWFRPKGTGLKWEDINFFQNDFSKDVGEILFGNIPADGKHISLMSPDNTSDGMLRKKWIIADGKRFLMKGANREFDYRQEPFNEVVASAVMRRLETDHIPYTLTFERGKPYSLCENFVTPDTELIPAWYVMNSYKKDNRDSDLTHLLRCCDRLGIPGVREAIDKMLTVDFIIANRDRHYGNFGFVREANTLAWKGFSPIYDSGTSLWHNTNFIGRVADSRPFRKSHDEQIKLVSDLSWYDYGSLDGIKDECEAILSRADAIDAERRGKIAAAVVERCESVERMRERKRVTSVSAPEAKKGIAERLDDIRNGGHGPASVPVRPKTPKGPER